MSNDTPTSEPQFEVQHLPVRIRPMDKERLTVRYYIAHTQVGRSPVVVEGSASRDTTNQEQGLVRHLKIDADKGWVSIDPQWVDNPGLCVIENITGKRPLIQPTPEEIAEFKTRVLRLKLANTDVELPFPVRPMGGIFIAEVDSNPLLQIRCESGVAEITIAFFPN
jgi:hypothetical protein